MSSARPRERLKSKRRKVRYVLFSLAAVLSLFIAGIALWALWQPWARIADVTVSGTTILLPYEVESVAEEFLKGEGKTRLVPADSVAFFSERRFEEELRYRFPRISTLSFSWNGLRDLEVSVGEREVYAQWCGVTYGEPSECYAFDTDGFLFAPTEPLEAYRTWYAPLALSHTSVPLRNYVFGEGVVRTADALLTGLRAEGVDIVSLALRTPDEADLFFSHGGRATYILGEEEHVLRVLPTLLKEKVSSESFEYIDLRFGRKVYIK